MDDLYRVADTDTRLRSFGEAALVVVGAFLVGFVLAGVGLVGLLSLGYTQENAPTLINVAGAVLQFSGFFLVLGWYFSTLRAFEDLVHLSVPGLRDVGWTLAGLVTLVATVAALSPLLRYLGAEPAGNQVVEVGRQDPIFFLYLLPVTVLFVAPAEELVFRGVVQGLMRRAYGVVPAILISGTIFGLVHYMALGGSGSRAVTILVVVALGVILGTVYELSENILVSVGVHALWNALIFLLNYADVTGAV